MNFYATIFIVAFVAMFSLPIAVAGIYYHKKKSAVLGIRQDYEKDVRYFGHSFSAMMEKALPSMKGDTIMLSKPEKVIEIKSKVHTFDVSEGNQINDLIVARRVAFHVGQSGLDFNNEIYSEQDVIILGEDTILRAVYSKERILLGDGTQVTRWADAEKTVVTRYGCDLGRSITSGEQLVIGQSNIFHRLYAPKIRLGQEAKSPDRYLETRDPKIFTLPVLNNAYFNRLYIDEDMIEEDGTVPYTIISKENVKVIEDIILQGDIHSDKSVRIMENSVVLGNIFAEKEVLIERNATVLGDVFTQGSIILEEGAAVGQPGKISSMIAREKITFYGNNYVFGFVSTEAGGRVL